MLSINSFKYGLDTRREALASLPGTLAQAVNCVIDSGGEIDKRKAFVDLGSLSTNKATYGIQDTDTGIMIFGGTAGTPTGLPANVVYQQLVCPFADMTIVSVIYSVSFLGKAFVIAKFSDGLDIATFVFYDGTCIGQVTDGIVGIIAPNLPETPHYLAIDLAAIVNRSTNAWELGTQGWLADSNVTYDNTANVIAPSTTNYVASKDNLTVVAGSVYKWTPGQNEDSLTNGTDTIGEAGYFTAATNSVTANSTAAAGATALYTGTLQLCGGTNPYCEKALDGSVLVMSPPGIRFTPTIINNNSVAGKLGVKLIDQDYPGVAAGAAVVAITFSKGATGTGTVTITAPANADGTGTAALTNGAINFVTAASDAAVALAVCNAINDNTFITGYSAKLQVATVTIYAPASFGAFQNNGGNHHATVVTTGDIGQSAGSVYSQIGVTVSIGKESITNVPGTGIMKVSRKITPVVTGLSTGAIATFSWSQVNSQGVDIASPANFFEISATTGANITITAGFNPGVTTLTGRFRVTATDSLNGTKAKYYFSVKMVV